MNIVVLAGGNSPERAVSLASGRLVSAALRRCGHRVLQLDPWRGVTAAETGSDPTSLFTRDGSADPPEGQGGEAAVDGSAVRLCRLADAVFPVLHGGAGENGQLQAMLDCFAVPYAGSGYAASLLAMEKPLSKLILRRGGLLTPDWCELTPGETVEAAVAHVSAEVGFPCVLKPPQGGSSLGVTVAADAAAVARALGTVQAGGERLMAERYVRGRELSVAVLDGEVLPPVEIVPRGGFYDYENKYRLAMAEELCPAPIGAEKVEELAENVRRAFSLLGLRGYGRADYLLDGEGRLWFLEFNTLPGMTRTSLLPREAAAAGISYEALCERMLRSAFL